MNETLAFQGRKLTLHRFPETGGKPLRAWDAADEYLLDHWEPPSGHTLIFHDRFGALGTALHACRPTLWSDSEMTRRALVRNLREQGLDPEAVVFLPADQDPSGPFERVLLKLPRNLDYFEDMLMRLRPCLAAGARILTGSMIKHTPARAYRLLEEILGATRTSPGRKKARLAFTRFDPERSCAASLAAPGFELPAEGLTLTAPPGVFSAARLDPGTRFLLPHLPRRDEELRILDVGCGNGVLSLVAAGRCPAARVRGVDESYRAVGAARTNAERAGLDPGRIEFAVAADLEKEPRAGFDLVLCNPPFHQGQVVGDALAVGLFRQIRPLLAPGGRLLVVGNRHLGYHARLKEIFGGVRTVDQDSRFVVLRA